MFLSSRPCHTSSSHNEHKRQIAKYHASNFYHRTTNQSTVTLKLIAPQECALKWYLKKQKKWLSRGSVLNTMKWKPWVFKTVSIPSDVRCLHLKQNALQKGNLFGRVETITPYIEGFHSSIDAKLIKSDITDVLVFVWIQTCTHLDRSSLVVVSVTINLNTKIKTDWTINLREGKLVFIKTKLSQIQNIFHQKQINDRYILSTSSIQDQWG